MKVVLVSTPTYPVALGLRYVSAALKSAGHAVKVIFMTARRDTSRADFSASILDALIAHCRDADLVGMSLMTNTFHRAAVLTRKIREAGVKAPVIWGGTHPTLAPEESLTVADMVCVGEGERSAISLLDRLEAGRDPTTVGGIGFRTGGPFGNRRTVLNPVIPLSDNLDEYPFPDYELDTHWVVDQDQLVPASPGNLRGTLHRLRVESTRGCPYHCAFCNNTVWQRLYRGKGPWVRRRSNDNVVAEIRQLRERFPTIEAVNVVDDLFFVRNEDAIDAFADVYRAEVNLPIELDAFPNTVTERKVASLARLPIRLVSLGIQSGSPDTLANIYHRPAPIPKIIECIDLFRRYGLRAEYHYIVCNPYEPDGNVTETMRFVASHHPPHSVLRVFPLALYPGTPLYERARRDGLIATRHENAYRYLYDGRTQFARHDYLSIWLRVVLQLRNIGVPAWFVHRLIDVVTHPLARKCLDRRVFTGLSFGLYRAARKAYKLFVHQPVLKPLRYLRAGVVRRRRGCHCTG